MLRVVAFSVLRDWELLGDHTDIAFKIFLYLLICGAALSVLKRYSHWEHPLVDARKEQWERGAVERKYLREKCWRGLLSNWRFFFKGKQLNSLAARDTSTPLWMMITISLRMLSEILSSWICFLGNACLCFKLTCQALRCGRWSFLFLACKSHSYSECLHVRTQGQAEHVGGFCWLDLITVPWPCDGSISEYGKTELKASEPSVCFCLLVEWLLEKKIFLILLWADWLLLLELFLLPYISFHLIHKVGSQA